VQEKPVTPQSQAFLFDRLQEPFHIRGGLSPVNRRHLVPQGVNKRDDIFSGEFE